MIPEAELRGLARRWNVDLMLLDLDYNPPGREIPCGFHRSLQTKSMCG